ncbi:hypothetical protein [Natronorubrum texcoconense]|uniref:Uncharacterized protein n=1 Tax=Natronorubrum texcoconense TaxID=1095776 RepID=A0A1G8X7H8_9EURY|nr:hypothetical protein [Natronorubrum texcoconense]SDJ86562.1 hypothetical protein SAMN04515672_1648 [Natronorubrum texcoconense]
MRPARLAPAVLCCTLLALAGVAVVVGAPPPTSLCGVCGPGVADDSEIDGSTGPGTLDIYVDDTGDSLWSARVPVTDSAADRYRTNETALEIAVDDAWVSPHAAGGDVRAVESTIDDETVVVNYTVTDVARSGVGDAWLVDYFADVPSNTRYSLTAERVTIHAPERTVVTNDPAHASVEGNTATWTQSDDSASGGDFNRLTYVTYGEDSIRDTASGYATIGLERGPPALERGVLGGLVPGALLLLAGVAVVRYDPGRETLTPATLERLFVAAGAIGAIGFLALSVAATGRPLSPGLGALSALGIGYASIGIAARRSDFRHSTRGVAGIAALVTLGTGVLLWLFGGPIAVVVLPFALATACFLPLGHASATRSKPSVPLLFAVLSAFVLIAGAVGLAFLSPPVGFGVILYWLVLAFWAAVIVAFGYPLGLMGRRLAEA